MSELNQEKLLSILETAFSHLLKDINYKETKAKYEQARQQIKEIIQKPGVTEEWIEEKAIKLGMMLIHVADNFQEITTKRPQEIGERAKDFIRSLVEEVVKK